MALLNFAKLENSSLTSNTRHSFAASHALALYKKKSVYSFIPKNACSTLRYSIAIENGAIDENSDVNWIHENNKTFVASQEFLLTAEYRFVVLRCPYRRVASVFLDKIVGGKEPIWRLCTGRSDRIKKKFLRDKLFDSLTFEGFVQRIGEMNNSDMDQHWRPQNDFLVYETYDDYFSLENFSDAVRKLNAIGLKIHDTRNRLKHDLSEFTKTDGDYSDTPILEIRKMKESGKVPGYSSLFNEKTRRLVGEIYRDDLDLFKQKIGNSALLFK